MADHTTVEQQAAVVDVVDVSLNDSSSSELATTKDQANENGDVAPPPYSSDAQLAPADAYSTTKADGAVKLRLGTTEHDSQASIAVPALLQNVVEKMPEHVALAAKRDGEWKKWTYKEYYEQSRIAAKAFIKLGLERFKSVCIIGFNSPEWFISNNGAIFSGGFSAGIYATNSPEACQFIAQDASANIIVVENTKQLVKILQVWDQLPCLKAVVQYTGELEDQSNPNVYDWASFMEMGKSCDDEELNTRLGDVKVNQCCSLVYTSGTTGNPKGVMLSHDNITFTAAVGCGFLGTGYGTDHVVSYLPLSHVAGQMLDMYVAMAAAGTVWFAQPDALKGSLGGTLKEVRPTIFFGVPRVWEKMTEKMLEGARSVTGVKRKIGIWAKEVGLKGSQNIEKGESRPMLWPLANALVFKKVKAMIGLDRCIYYGTGAAPICMETLRYMQSIDLSLCELYGMSECSGPATVGKVGMNRTGACGKSMVNWIVKINNPDKDGEGEILIKGRHVFMGYLNNEEKTKETLDEDGFIHSGDIGRFDEDGYMYITGRIKELIITAGGENIAPVPIESRVKTEIPFISNVMLIGDKRKFLSCLITLKVVMNLDTGAPTDKLTDLAIDSCKKFGSDVTTVSEFLKTKDEKLMKAIQDGIDCYNEHAMSNAQKIQKFIVLEDDFSIPGGELGPTMKIRRPVVLKKYAEQIDAMYQ